MPKTASKRRTRMFVPPFLPMIYKNTTFLQHTQDKTKKKGKKPLSRKPLDRMGRERYNIQNRILQTFKPMM